MVSDTLILVVGILVLLLMGALIGVPLGKHFAKRKIKKIESAIPPEVLKEIRKDKK